MFIFVKKICMNYLETVKATGQKVSLHLSLFFVFDQPVLVSLSLSISLYLSLSISLSISLSLSSR